MFAKLLDTFAAPAVLKASLAALALGAAPTAALAHDDFRIDLDFHHGRPHIEFRQEARPCPVPIYEERGVRVWVSPVYRSVCDRQWVAPEYRTIASRTWVPAVYETRDVVRYIHAKRCIERGLVVVCPGHFEETSHTELVCEGHFQNVDRQELVTPGHYEVHVERVAVVPQW